LASEQSPWEAGGGVWAQHGRLERLCCILVDYAILVFSSMR